MTFPQSINHQQAIKLILQQLEKQELLSETINLNSASGRVLAEPLVAPVDVPAYDCSRMDGYAVNLKTIQTSNEDKLYTLNLGEPIHAAAQTESVLCHDQAVPIMTGGMMPDDANAIILKEQVKLTHNQIEFKVLPKPGQFIRTVGSDIKQGELIIRSGQCLNVAHLGIIASIGINDVKVIKKPSMGLMMTGDELVQPGSNCLPGQIFDANTSMLSALLAKMGCEVSVLNGLADTQEAVSERMALLKHENYDVVISVGGVSMGDKDWIPAMLAQHGEVVFHKVLIKPGFPMIFGYLNGTLFYGLPGNPVSAYTTLCQYVFPAIQVLKKQQVQKMLWTAKLSHDLLKTHQRREYFRGFYHVDENGQFNVSIASNQQSSHIQVLADANCFVVVDQNPQELKVGSDVLIQPFSQFFT